MKALLLDTHVVLWALSDPARLGDVVRRRIESPDTTVLVSAVTGWEMEIKRALGKLEIPDDFQEQLGLRRFSELPVRLRHVAALRDLPPLHRDPFDRMLVAQAMADDLILVSHDDQVLSYPVPNLRVPGSRNT